MGLFDGFKKKDNDTDDIIDIGEVETGIWDDEPDVVPEVEEEKDDGETPESTEGAEETPETTEEPEAETPETTEEPEAETPDAETVNE